jgi:hypothetical protein
MEMDMWILVIAGLLVTFLLVFHVTLEVNTLERVTQEMVTGLYSYYEEKNSATDGSGATGDQGA